MTAGGTQPGRPPASAASLELVRVMSPVAGDGSAAAEVASPLAADGVADADAPGTLGETRGEALGVAETEAEASGALLVVLAARDGAGAALVAGLVVFVLFAPDFVGAGVAFALGAVLGAVVRSGCGAVPGCLRVFEDCHTNATVSPARTGWV